MEEDIKILEELISEYKNNVWNEYPYKFNKEIIYTLENLLTRYKQLEEENKELKHITQNYNVYQQKSDNPNTTIIIADEKWFINGYFKENFIPKSKVKEKIEELKEKTAMQGLFIDSETICRVDAKIQVLQELLREE